MAINFSFFFYLPQNSLSVNSVPAALLNQNLSKKWKFFCRRKFTHKCVFDISILLFLRVERPVLKLKFILAGFLSLSLFIQKSNLDVKTSFDLQITKSMLSSMSSKNTSQFRFSFFLKGFGHEWLFLIWAVSFKGDMTQPVRLSTSKLNVHTQVLLKAQKLFFTANSVS